MLYVYWGHVDPTILGNILSWKFQNKTLRYIMVHQHNYIMLNCINIIFVLIISIQMCYIMSALITLYTSHQCYLCYIMLM